MPHLLEMPLHQRLRTKNPLRSHGQGAGLGYYRPAGLSPDFDYTLSSCCWCSQKHMFIPHALPCPHISLCVSLAHLFAVCLQPMLLACSLDIRAVGRLAL